MSFALPRRFAVPAAQFGKPSLRLRPGILVCGVLPVLAALSPMRVGVVNGASMAPTMADRSLFLFDRDYYKSQPMTQGDIVVIRDERGTRVKRIYATGGSEFFAFMDPLESFVRRDPIDRTQRVYFERLAASQRKRGVACRVLKVKVPKDCLFVVGDAPWSEDSRTQGFVCAENVIGRVTPLPGQTLAAMPEWIERSSPNANKTKRQLAAHPKPRTG